MQIKNTDILLLELRKDRDLKQKKLDSDYYKALHQLQNKCNHDWTPWSCEIYYHGRTYQDRECKLCELLETKNDS